MFRRDENGFHYFVGRTDDMFVSGGENIYPADVERMLERHPAVAQAAVVPVDDDIKGQKPVAFVIPKAGQAPSEDEMKKFALAHAPAYQHPRFVWFVDELPLASTNKVDRDLLMRTAGRAGEGSAARIVSDACAHYTRMRETARPTWRYFSPAVASTGASDRPLPS